MKLLGGDFLLWQGGLNIGPLRSTRVNAAPIAVADSLSITAGNRAVIDVLANDTDPDGDTLTVTEASAENGEASVTTDGFVAYSAPESFSGVDLVRYGVRDTAGNVTEGTLTVDVVRLELVSGPLEGEFRVISGHGDLSIEIIEDSETRTYQLVMADLDRGPVNLRPPRIAGIPGVGETLTSDAGLWAFDEAQGDISISRVWKVGTPGSLEGASDSYVVTPSDAGKTLVLVETATTASGPVSVTSQAVSIPDFGFWTPEALPDLEMWLDPSDTSTVTASGYEVRELADKSGNDHHAIPRFATGPKLGTVTAPSGLQMMDCGTDEALRFPQTVSGAGPRSIVMVIGEKTGGDRRCLSLGNNWSFWSWVAKDVNGAFVWRLAGNGTNVVTDVSSETAGLVGFFHSGPTYAGSALMRDGVYNGQLTNDQTVVNTPSGDGNLGAHGHTSGYAPGPIGEVVFCRSALSVEMRQKLEGYLAHKWGYAANLPDDHPYRSSVPRA